MFNGDVNRNGNKSEMDINEHCPRCTKGILTSLYIEGNRQALKCMECGENIIDISMIKGGVFEKRIYPNNYDEIKKWLIKNQELYNEEPLGNKPKQRKRHSLFS